MLPVTTWPPGAPGRWGSPFSRPWLVDASCEPCGFIIPKGCWLVRSHSAWIGMRIRLDFAWSEPQPVRSPDPPPPPFYPPNLAPPLPPPPPPPVWRIFTVARPRQTTTVWSDGQNVRICGGRAMLIQVFSA